MPSSRAISTASGKRFFAAADDYGRYVQSKCRTHGLGIGDPGNEQAAGLGKCQHIAHEIGAEGGFYLKAETVMAGIHICFKNIANFGKRHATHDS